MKQYSFLDESFRKVIRRLSKLTPENAKKAGENYILNRTKTNNLNDAATVYGRKIHSGIKTKLDKIAKQHKRNLRIIDIDDSAVSGTAVANPLFKKAKDVIAIPSETNEKFSPDMGWIKNRTFGITKRDVKKHNKEILKQNINKELNNALIANHELDEYQNILDLAKRNNLDPFQVQNLSIDKMRRYHTTGDHVTGVLRKEKDRNHAMAMLFGRDKFHITPRTQKEVAINSRPFKPKKIKEV